MDPKQLLEKVAESLIMKLDDWKVPLALSLNDEVHVRNQDMNEAELCGHDVSS